MAKLTLYLDNRKVSKSGEYPIVIRLSNLGTTAHIPTGISVREDLWCSGMIIGKENRRYNDILNFKLSDARYRLTSCLQENSSLLQRSAIEIKSIMYAHERALECGETSVTRVCEFYSIFVSRKTKEKTREQYEYMKYKVSQFADWQTLMFEDISVSWLKNFHASMERKGNSHNTCADVEINLRALFNAAIEEGLVSRDIYPFKTFKVRKAETRKRSLSLEQLRELMRAHKEPHQEKYFDCFMLSIYLCGINMVDLLNLPPLVDKNHIGYIRSKTGIWVEFDIPLDAKRIIEKYKGETHMVNFAEGCTNYESFVDHMNAELKRIGEVTYTYTQTRTGKRKRTHYKPINKQLSSYWARHTFATIAFDCDMPEQLIDMAMAHKSPFPMTDIYIARNMAKINKYLPMVCDVINDRSKEEKPL